MRQPIVEFAYHEVFEDILPTVRPATNFIPDEYRRMPRKLDTENVHRATVKACAPYFDGMTHGFIIPCPVDVRIISDGESVKYFYRNPKYATSGERQDEPWWMTHHESEQVEPAISGKAVLKFMNPYYIKTRKGWGSLFLSPLNRDTLFRPLAGLVNTSRYFSRVNIIGTWEGGPGDFEIRQGEPLVQIVPVKLGKFSYKMSSLSDKEAELRDKPGQASIITRDGYKTKFREKVSWSNVSGGRNAV